jgi:hypothetical protein
MKKEKEIKSERRALDFPESFVVGNRGVYKQSRAERRGSSCQPNGHFSNRSQWVLPFFPLTPLSLITFSVSHDCYSEKDVSPTITSLSRQISTIRSLDQGRCRSDLGMCVYTGVRTGKAQGVCQVCLGCYHAGVA